MFTIPVLLMLFSTVLVNAESMPPHIHTQSEDRVIYFRPTILHRIKLPCLARGNPEPIYTWYLNGRQFNISDQPNVELLEGGGTLSFKPPPSTNLLGVYQCHASNVHGVSVSDNVALRRGRLDQFEYEPPQTFHVELGDSLMLPCVPPYSDPPATVTWVLMRDGESKYGISDRKRHSTDFYGRLWFAYVEKDDEWEGKWLNFVHGCKVWNFFMGEVALGPEINVRVNGNIEKKHPPQELWTSPTDQLVLKGGTLRLKCIFGGNPAPNITWTKTGAELPDRVGMYDRNKQLLEIPDVEMSDAGEYVCEGSSNEYTTRVNKVFNVTVEVLPYWIKEPQAEVNKSIGDSATFTCTAGGIPEPTYSWFINGVALADTRDPRIYQSSRVQGPNPNNLTISNLTVTDNMVIQCNATNKHGYLWSDVPLGIEEPDCAEVDNKLPCKCTSYSCDDDSDDDSDGDDDDDGIDGSNTVTYSTATLISLALVALLITL